MKYVCPICGMILPREIDIIIPHTDEHIVEEIKKRRPDWVDRDGLCKRCYEYYRDQVHPRE